MCVCECVCVSLVRTSATEVHSDGTRRSRVGTRSSRVDLRETDTLLRHQVTVTPNIVGTDQTPGNAHRNVPSARF